MRAIIFGNGEIYDYKLIGKHIQPAADKDLIICCDGGLRHAKQLDLMPDYIVGDCDSVSQDLLFEYRDKGVEVKEFPKEKDFTDMELALELAISSGVSNIDIFGAVGNRLDHSLANAYILLKPLRKGIKAKLLNESNEVMIIDNQIELYKKIGAIVSLIPLTSEVCGVSTRGLKYPLKDETLYMGETRGISNVFLEENISIHIESGLLFVILSRD